MHSPYVGSLLATPQSRISVNRKLSFQSLGGFNAGPDSPGMKSVASTTNTIEFYRTTSTFGKYGGWMALIGGFLFQLTLGAWFCFGNLIPYIASYMAYHMNKDQHFTLSDDELHELYMSYCTNGNIVFFIAMAFNGLCCIFGGNLELNLGPTKTLIITGLLISSGFGLTYFGLIWKSFSVIYITFGVVFGAGVGLGYPVQPIVCMRWFPEKRGVVNGFTSAVFGSGPFFFNPIQTKLINPLNVAMDERIGFSHNVDIVERVPVMFLYVAVIMLIMQSVSLLFIRSPPWFVSIADAGAGGHGISKSQLKYNANSLTVKQALMQPSFWMLFVTNLLYTLILCWLCAQWKVFSSGYMGITDDGMLSIIGSICALSNGVGRFFWGVFYDWTASYKRTQSVMAGIATVFCLTIPFVRIEGDMSTTTVLLTIWMIVMWGCAGCNYSFIPSVLIETYGAKHVGELLGIFIVAEPIAVGFICVLSSFPFLNTYLQYNAWIVGSLSAVSIILCYITKLDLDRKQFLSGSGSLNKKVNLYDSV